MANLDDKRAVVLSPPTDDEKVPSGTGEFETATGDGLSKDPDAGLNSEERAAADRKLLWKLDLQLIPWLCFLYLCSFLDRTNIGNAKIDGLESDLHMTGGQYNASLSIFFVSYSLFEPLTNVLLKRLRPSVFIPIIMILWGICMTCMGLVHDFSGLAAARFFLGVAEAGLFPGVNYYLSCWYVYRSEFGIRAAIFFSAAAVAGSFGGLLAAAIAQMKGIGGKPGWAWIFILEGLATILVGIASYWMVHDFPDEAKFLTPQDRERVIRRLKADQQSSAEHEEFKMTYFWASVTDWKTWAFAVCYMGCDGALYAFSLFLPTIISQLVLAYIMYFQGYTSTMANLLSVPPYAAAACVTVLIGWMADRTRLRGYCNIGISFLGIAGFSMLLASDSPGVQYAGTFLGACGIYPCVANTISWASNNVEGVYKRGVTLGIVIGWGNLNGVVSSNIYRQQDKPRYLVGHGVVLGYMVVFLLGGSIITHLALRSENAKRRRGDRDHWIEGKTRSEIELLGDRRPDFAYTL
ncbi:putative MFS transporter [Saccharata proteae CBS 121410]|uniref:MFS transporter n=1 Tax=Saccharata proteae CBS 121410 TaxID=1314787 RepID=A0A9P4HQS3_9PEZI|nr:putative MFS transporter [Saccharata proteae CBS 121410]